MGGLMNRWINEWMNQVALKKRFSKAIDSSLVKGESKVLLVQLYVLCHQEYIYEFIDKNERQLKSKITNLHCEVRQTDEVVTVQNLLRNLVKHEPKQRTGRAKHLNIHKCKKNMKCFQLAIVMLRLFKERS